MLPSLTGRARRALIGLLGVLALAGFAHAAPANAGGAGAKTTFNAKDCYECHEAIQGFHEKGDHKTVGCNSCHTGLDAHRRAGKGRPTTSTDPATCGSCHQNQYRTMYTMNTDKTAHKEKAVASGGALDKLLMPHGFTREHNEPRSHAFALYDQLTVDRSFGGRFSDKQGKEGLARNGGNFKLWDVLKDDYPGEPHKTFKPGTAAAANPVCMSCKTADHILDWAYMGDPQPGAKWSRLSKVNEFVKDTNHSLNCVFCHDPHGAGPRVIRDGLIQALTRPEKDTLWHKDPKGAKIDVKELGERGFVRKIATLSRYDTKLQCAQCHVEYNCNPGFDPVTGKPIGMDDQRTNHFPLKAVNDIGQHYKDLKFGDFKHAVTGATLWKGQHPDVEVFYNSTHQKAGAECASCHMPKVKDAKTGKTFTSHWQTSPRHYVKETCLGCHKTWTEKQAVYTIDSLKNKWTGKMRKAEFWLTRLVDKFEAAQNMGVDAAVLNEARAKHSEAHIHWEWWSAANGAHFHNPQMFEESINKGMGISQAAVKLLDDAMAKRGAARQAAAPATVPVVANVAAPAAVSK
ncbi:ammonia-forming cytochrome c nitrite reductase subunit c552 [Ramlibacter sp.]|uniref:ammonia-forming cytochrome c nitrite reductase subunit c552 n=1 Tax=Ramlibacter sp. TaxID=1917967 RepID=UPI002C5DF55F|nr:ammonia-forming cytochrome c nitrite reductase subunit c552 [Ramlibacter sp.]HWI80725.1 ammonia-forming cytochrome c nitrite reductase subunit c552 [Ramlibacter sp.]